MTALARGESGDVPDAATLVVADRARPDAYAAVAERNWDAVVEISWQPAFVREALSALGERAAHWTLISSTSVYASAADIDADESAATFPPLRSDRADKSEYGAAKAAAEQVSREALDGRLLVVRPGLIGGPGDETGRSGAWVARAALAPDAPLLVPDELLLPTQIVDVRDLVAFIVASAERRLRGTVNAVGPVVPLGEWIEESRRIGGHRGEVVSASSAWLMARGVEEFMGEGSLALWLADPDFAGFSARSGRAAEAAGLAHRPRSELIGDVLEWERSRGLGRPRRAGLSAEREAELLRLLASG